MVTITMTNRQYIAMNEAVLLGAFAQHSAALVCLISNNQGTQRGDALENEHRDLTMAIAAIMTPTD